MKALKAKKPSAADLNRIAAHLPTKQAEDKQREELTELFSTAARAGAGGTRAGSVGLRLLGKRGMDFVESMLPKREKPKSNSYDKDLPAEGPKNGFRRAVDGCLKLALPRHYCPDCDRHDLPQGVAGVCINFNMYPEGRPEWQLSSKDLVLSFFCLDCYNAQLRSQHDNANELYVTKVTGIAKKGDYDAANRLTRIKKNTENFIKARIACGDESIYVTKH